MKISVHFTRAILGLGLASSLFLGCEQFLGQAADKTAKPEDAKTDVNVAPETVALQLAIKETEDCKALRDQVLAAHAAGQAPGALETEFIAQCVVEVKSTEVADKAITVPASLVPDDLTRCRWIVSQIDAGNRELTIKFRYYCPDDCDSLAAKDSVRHVKLCGDPAPDCAALKKKLAAMDSTTEEFARLRRFLHEHCGVPDPTRPPKDTVRPVISYCDSLRHLLATVKGDSAATQRVLRELTVKCPNPIEPKPDPALTTCDSLRKKLGSLDPASDEYAKLKAYWYERCEEPRDTVIVPKPQPTECEQILMKLKALDPASPDYARLKQYYAEKCTDIKPLPVPTTCDSLRKQLMGMDPASPEYAKLKETIRLKCEVPRDTVKTPVVTECDGILMKLKALDPASPDYARLKQYYSERCVEVKPLPIEPKPIEPKPVDPKPVDPKPISPCDAYRMKLASVPADSPDAQYIKDLIAKECLDPIK